MLLAILHPETGGHFRKIDILEWCGIGWSLYECNIGGGDMSCGLPFDFANGAMWDPACLLHSSPQGCGEASKHTRGEKGGAYPGKVLAQDNLPKASEVLGHGPDFLGHHLLKPGKICRLPSVVGLHGHRQRENASRQASLGLGPDT